MSAMQPVPLNFHLLFGRLGNTDMQSDFHDQVIALLPKLRVQVLASTRHRAAAGLSSPMPSP
jgi:hypothetical protein